MHKVIIISGSPRKDGNTMDLLHIAAEKSSRLAVTPK